MNDTRRRQITSLIKQLTSISAEVVKIKLDEDEAMGNSNNRWDNMGLNSCRLAKAMSLIDQAVEQLKCAKI